MPLPREYGGQACSLARSLEIIGERWTLLIVRDAFYGVRRFGDFVGHLAIPRAVLTERLTTLVDAYVMERVQGDHGHPEYVLTDKGLRLWPAVRSLIAWGDDFYSAEGPRRVFQHVDDGGGLDELGVCTVCGRPVAAQDTLIAPGPGLAKIPPRTDAVTVALGSPHRLLEPLRV
jgi:DNA-binding HxlR family transcriptional regulator